MNLKTIIKTCGLVAVCGIFSAAGLAQEKNRIAPVEKAIVRTVDGLPLEVEIVSLEGEEIRVRSVISGRIFLAPISMQDEELQKRMKERAEKVHKELKAMKFRVEVLENPSRDRMLSLVQTTPVLNPDGSRAFRAERKSGDSPSAPPPTRVLLPGGRCLRIYSLVNFGVNVPVKVQIYWYAKLPQKTMWSMEFSETVMLDIPASPGNFYYSLPHSFPKPVYQGFSVLITNPANGAILWKDASSPMYLEELEIRHKLREAPASTVHSHNSSKPTILAPLLKTK